MSRSSTFDETVDISGLLMSRSKRGRPKKSKEAGAEDYWVKSPPPEDDWGVEDINKEWVFKIVDEVVGHDNEILYQLQWEDWEREDGTNTTWHTNGSVNIPLPTKEWEAERKANLPRNGQVKVWSPADVVNMATWNRKQIGEPVSQRNAVQLMEDRNRLMEWINGGSIGPHPLKPRTSSTRSQRSPPKTPSRQNGSADNLWMRQSNSKPGPSRISQAQAGPSTIEIPDSPQAPTRTRAISISSSSSSSDIQYLGSGTPEATEFSRSPSKGKGKAQLKMAPPTPNKSRLPSEASTSSSTVPSVTRTPVTRSSSNISNNTGDGSLRKRRGSPLLERMCANGCGSELPPPDVSRGDLCDTCVKYPKPWKRIKVAIDDSPSKKNSETPGIKRDKSKSTKPENNSSTSWKVKTHIDEDRPKAQLPRRKGKERARVFQLRLDLAEKWTLIAKNAERAEAIMFANDLDDEELPSSISPTFQYLEDEYTCDDALSEVPQLSQFYNSTTKQLEIPGACFVNCGCRTSDLPNGVDCINAAHCACQSEKNGRGFAYTNERFNFNYAPNEVIVECNSYCSCSTRCGNRIAQRPRQVPIEIFKTPECGWGVRSTADVNKGQVLGLYTGKLIRRWDAEQLTGAQKDFCFDLDYQDDEQDPECLLSIDSWQHGNWTRFINHSCDPNLLVQPVVYETILEQNAGYLAFIARGFIPAGTEFNFDYNPRAAPGSPKSRKKARDKNHMKQMCHCGSVNCRGFLW
ncbi:Lanosterol 14-alpha-demethylase [Mycena indigotica]|uniref:Lanosterol 14-alpha-demethylase n=1 Tax=Mycena indigotica TaxID=2126181 RepID=A0A8H6T5H8_9AGAR|nr:Lanosterol 14-alpha-demethylase [Mycena indigotica]KAF7312455.1 Lanosterol 14-alpha-demethylase [Mycena indigotica]